MPRPRLGQPESRLRFGSTTVCLPASFRGLGPGLRDCSTWNSSAETTRAIATKRKKKKSFSFRQAGHTARGPNVVRFGYEPGSQVADLTSNLNTYTKHKEEAARKRSERSNIIKKNQLQVSSWTTAADGNDDGDGDGAGDGDEMATQAHHNENELNSRSFSRVN